MYELENYHYNTTTTTWSVKLNAMGKEISIMSEIIAEFADLYLKDTVFLSVQILKYIKK
ncbi:hypothetical protein ACN6KJ_17050 (plasmid) [Enterococcus faecium]|uniref:hypothetical protein n=1 Tax=Enterococcus faecium TaxID=1352 RepID=UPI003F4E687A